MPEADPKKCLRHNRYGCTCWEAEQEAAATSASQPTSDKGDNGPDGAAHSDDLRTGG